jgi:O-succinylbenzoic acid--CoA ligase
VPGTDSEAPAVVILTSGTEGRPKGVVLSAAALAASADAWLAFLPPATGWLLAVGLGHVAGLGVAWRAIRGRVPITMAPADAPEAQLAALRASPAPSHVSLVPAQLARLLDAASGERAPATIRAVLLGGGPIPPPLVIRALDAGWPVIPTYGLTETASGVTALPTLEARAAPASAGRPLPSIDLHIENPGPDGVGEVVVTGPSGFSGYLGGAPRRRFDPVASGDLGRLDAQGRLLISDRRTDRIVRGGENVSPAEVEAVLETHPAVAEAAVVGRPDPLMGQVPVAAVVIRAGRPDTSDAELVAHARAGLAGFKVPAGWLRLDALPRTPAGKLQREAVRALVDGSPAGSFARPGGDRIGWRISGDGPLPLLLLPGTLSTAAQLESLAASMARRVGATVHAVDRRGMGSSRLGVAGPVDVGVHVRDLVAYLDARDVATAVIVGISFGGVVALELAARAPGRVSAVVAWEPPYGALADAAGRSWFGTVAERTADASRSRGSAAAAETFLRLVAGDAAWDGLTERSRAYLAAEGDGAVADSALLGLGAGGLSRIVAPTTIVTGGASRPFYEPLADAIVARVPGGRRLALVGRAHTWPLTDPAGFGDVVRSALAESGGLEDIGRAAASIRGAAR